MAAIHERIENSKYVGHLAAFMSFGGGVLLTANAYNPENIFNVRGMAAVLGGSALSLVECDMAKKSCTKMVDFYKFKKTNIPNTTLLTEQNVLAKYGSSVAAGIGTSLAFNTYQAVGQVTESTIAISALASWGFMVAGCWGFKQRIGHLNECKAELSQQISQHEVAS